MHTCHNTRRPRSAMTLLELILAMVLMATLLATTWSLMGIYRDRLERSQEQAEQRQLIRSLHQSLADDLQSSRFVPWEGNQGQDASAAVSGDAVVDDSSQDTAPDDNDSPSTPPSMSSPRPELPGRPGTTAGDAVDPLGAASLSDSATASSQATNLLIDPILTRDWLEPGPLFVGASQALLIDMVPPALPGQRQPPTEEPSLETAALPDSLRRVVYAFTSPGSALVQGRPAGLIRCELTLAQLLALQRTMGAAPDLLTFLRPRLPKHGPNAAAQPTDSIDAAGMADSSALGGATADRSLVDGPAADGTSLADALDPLANDASLSPSAPSLFDMTQQIDYAPELATFTLRYHDGSGWRSSWDSRREKGQVPVAVEVRFQLKSELEPTNQEDQPADGLESSGTTEVLEALNQAVEPEPLDDELRSALTKPPEDHRYVIFLRDPGQQQAADGVLGGPDDGYLSQEGAVPSDAFGGDGSP